MKENIKQIRWQIVSIIGEFMFLVPLLTLAGCMVNSNEFHTSMDRDWAVAKHIGLGSSLYYQHQGHWPQSLDDLRFLVSNKGLDPDWKKHYEEVINTIPWLDLKDGITFNQMPNGKLCISFPQLLDKAANRITAIVDVPKVNGTSRHSTRDAKK